MKNGQIFDLAKTQKTTEKHPNHYKNAHFSCLCRRKDYSLNAYAGVRSLCSFYLFSTKKTPFIQSVFFFNYELKRQFDSINIACWCRLLISLLRWLWLLIALLLLWLLISLLLLYRLLNLLSLLISNFC